MIEPEEAQRIHRQDQVDTAMRIWAETLASARDQLMKAGFTREEAVGIATQWVSLVIAHNLGAGRVA
jgi:hypothetical protein